MTIPAHINSIKTTCPYCGVGCGVQVKVPHNRQIEVKGDPDHPTNKGRLCSKGLALGDTIALDGRGLEPMVGGKSVSWEFALDTVAERLRRIIDQYGPQSVAFYGSGQMLTEDYYVANKLMKGFIGSANMDTNSRLCMASAVAGHKRAFGSDTVPGVYADLEEADLIVVVGANPSWCHPVLWQRVMAVKDKRKNMKIVVIDPRRTATADLADFYLPIVSDGDVALFNGLFRYLLEHDMIATDFVRNHTQGLENIRENAMQWSLTAVASHTGLEPSLITAFFDLFLQTEKVVTFFSMGVNQSSLGTDKVNAIINCHLLTGRIGRSGMGPFSMTGQPNAMGGREVGGLANILAAHMEFDKADEVAKFWRAPNIARKAGLKAVDIFEKMLIGDIKAIWIMATNPVVSMPDADCVKQALQNCNNVIVSDMFSTTDTALMADIFLPAAGWGEKDGTVTNSERRISRQRAFLPLPGHARPDWWIICEVAKRLGYGDAFSFNSPADIFTEHVALTGINSEDNRDFNLQGLNGVDYTTMVPVQWPVKQNCEMNIDGKRFFGDGRFYTDNQKAQFLDIEVPPKKWRSPHQFILNSGRVRDHWHTMTRTGRSAKLSSHYSESFVEIHPDDARHLGIRGTQLVRLENKNGHVMARALVTDRQQQGHVFVPMHWTGENSENSRLNVLMARDRDPISGQPALKSGVVTLSPAKVGFYGFLVSRQKPKRHIMDYMTIAPCEGGWRAELAGFSEKIDMNTLVNYLFGKDISDNYVDYVDYVDHDRSVRSLAQFSGTYLNFVLYVSPYPVLVERYWAAALLAKSSFSEKDRYRILAGRTAHDIADKGKIICACLSIGRNEIINAISKNNCQSVEAIGEYLGAGTNCGSCRSEIRGIIHETIYSATTSA